MLDEKLYRGSSLTTLPNVEVPLVSVVVSNHNGCRIGILPHCLGSIFRLDYPRFEVLVVDNASDDESVEFLEKYFSRQQVRIVKNLENNYSKGLNMGAREAKGEFIAYFNNDTEVDSHYLKEIVRAFQQESNVGLAQGKLLSFHDRTRIDSVGETMDLFGNPVSIGGGKLDYPGKEPLDILSASGSACICRRSALEEAGYYDERYHIFYEDMDLALRMRSRGYSVLHFPGAIVYHIRGKTDLSPELKAENKYHFNKNRIATMVKNYDLPSLLVALPIVALMYSLALVLESIKDRRLAFGRLKSAMWNMKHMRYLVSKRRAILDSTIVGFNITNKLLYRRRISELVMSFSLNLVG
jgi:GT2 family glycosyltransferase